MPTVFLSYSRTDLSLIEQLEAQLKGHPEISIWRDQEKIYGGQKWPKVLGEAIADQDVFLLAWSNNSAASHFVELEWNTAIALKKAIVPCLFDDTVLAPILSALHGHRLDDVSSLIKTLAVAPLADAQRQRPVIERLNEIVETEEKAVLEQAKTIFTLQQWIVQGDFYQIANFNYYAAPKLREPVLRGRVFFIADNDELKAAEEVNVTLLQTAAKTQSDSDGLFTLPLPDTFQPGTKVEVGIKKEDWVIYAPIDGEIIIPALDSDLVRIRLVQKGSKKLWSADRIEKFIQDLARKAKEQVRPEGKPQDIDFRRYIKDWATQYGFSAQQAKAQIDRWVAEVERQNDPYHLGLAADTRKNFGLAGRYFEESAELKLKKMQETEETVRMLREDTVRDYRLAGDARFNQYEFESALMCYRHALRLVSKKGDSRLWADISIEIAKSHNELGIRIEGDQIPYHFAQAVKAYNDVLTVYIKDTFPQWWAMIQNNLGGVLKNQGTRTEREAGINLLAQAVNAYRAALTVRTQKTLPQDWAATQNNLGSVLRNQGTRSGKEAGTQLLAQAVNAYRAALTVRTKKAFPQDWAATQNNLGNVLSERGTHTPGRPGTQLLAQAVKAYRASLTVYTKETSPQQWAIIQNNLGNALRNLGPRTRNKKSGMQLLAQAVNAYKAALTVRKKKTFPQDWATTQHNLGNALRSYGTRSAGKAGTQLLTKSVIAYRRALTVRTVNLLPQQWATTSSNLAETLFLCGRFSDARHLLTNMLQCSGLDPETKVALLIIVAVNFVALGTLEHVRHCFDKLQQALGETTPDFILKRSFKSIKLFISKDAVFTKHRSLLLAFIKSVENQQRDKLFSAVKSGRKRFLKIAKS